MITVNNNIVSSSTLNGIGSVSYTYLGDKVYAAQKLERIYGIFLSNTVQASDSFLKWKTITIDRTQDPNSKVYLLLRTSDDGNFDNAEWMGPFYNETTDISSITGGYMQFMVVLRSDTNSSTIPKVNEIDLSYYSSENSVKFFTHAFRIGFQPDYILLTYNAKEVDDAIIRFAVSGVDSTDLSNYQYIEPNKIESLSGLTYASQDLKIMAEIIGSSEAQVVLNEFAVTFSGDVAYRVNKCEFSSSSLSSASSDSSMSSESNSSSSSSESSNSSSSNSSSSSSSFDDAIYVEAATGVYPIPDGTGVYHRDGIFGGFDSWKRVDGSYFIFERFGNFVINNVKNVVAPPLWINMFNVPVGLFNALFATGDLFASYNELSSSSSSSSSSS